MGMKEAMLYFLQAFNFTKLVTVCCIVAQVSCYSPDHMAAVTESDVRAAYVKLRALMLSGAEPPDAKRTEIETQIMCIYDFMRNTVAAYEERQLTDSDLKRYAEEALAEGHVELFEKAADWSRLFSAKELTDLGPWSQCLHWLYHTINFRAGSSLKLFNRLAKSKHFVRMEEMTMRWDINDENKLRIAVKNDLILLNAAPDASVTLKGLYPIVLEIYNTKKLAQFLLLYLQVTRTLRRSILYL